MTVEHRLSCRIMGNGLAQIASWGFPSAGWYWEVIHDSDREVVARALADSHAEAVAQVAEPLRTEPWQAATLSAG